MTPASLSDAALRVVLIEDDAVLRERILLPGLANFGFAVTGLSTAAQLHEHLRARPVDIVVLDVGLPDGDGFAIAGEIRMARPTLGIVMLTGRGDTHDRVRGLCQGADAYLAKPVEIDLLAATLHSLARRLVPAPAQVSAHWHLERDGWCLVSPTGGTVALTRTERRVVERLLQTPGHVVTREQLIGALTSNVFDFDPHRLDSLIYRLRRKVAGLCGDPLPLTAIHGEGYVFTDAA